MRKLFIRNNRIIKRVVSFALAAVLVLNGLPVDIISDRINENSELVMVANAAENLDADALAALTARYSANAYSFTSGGNEFSEYSQCFQDDTWAANHANDVITLNPVANKFVFDSNYSPIGNESAAFDGSIIYNTTAEDFAVDANSPIFNYVKDSVKLGKMDNGSLVNIPLNINRVADVGATVSPLFALHAVGSGASVPYEWKVTLNDPSTNDPTMHTHSYSGVIYEMTGGAKINLTFIDNSDHTPAKDANQNIVSGSIIDNKEDGKNYGILCGKIAESSQLTATYTNTADTAITFIGTGSAYCGGFIGEINASTFTLSSGSSSVKVDFKTAKTDVGFICGHVEGSTITLPTGYTFQGEINGNDYAGGIAGYCKNTTINYESSTGTIDLANCNIKNGTTTGGVFGYYECNTVVDDIMLNRTYSLTNCKVEGTGLSGGIAGEYKPTYSSAVTIDLDDYSFDNIIQLKTGTSAGGLFGKYTANGSVTITDSDTTNIHFVPPASSVKFGGVIGEYVNSHYSNTLTLSNFTVNNLNCTSSGSVGGVIGTLSGSTYVSVSGVSVTNVTANNANYFGGIISTLNSNNAGSFLDVTGNFTLSMTSGKTYKGGALAGSFKTGVIRLAGLTDISDAKAENGYAQLVYENDETLVYALGSGSNYVAAEAAVTDPETGEIVTPATPASGWTLKRNAATTASDLGQWGEVVRLFDVVVSGETVTKNAEEAGIVSFADNKVTVAQGVIALTDTVSFAKCALNMQLNDGDDHGALCFADKTTYPKSELLKSAITVSGEIDLSGTGLLGLTRDGGNGKYYDVNNDNSKTAYKGESPDFFEGSVTGSSSAKISLSIGEKYGTYPTGTADSSKSGGAIYLSGNYGHDSIGLFSHTKNATIKTLEISGAVDVRRNDGGGAALYLGSAAGFMTNGLSCEGVTVSTAIDIYRIHENGRFYIGGVAGLFDGTSGSGTLEIKASSSVSPTITLHGANAAYGTDNYDSRNAYIGGVLGLLGGKTSTEYSISITSSAFAPIIVLGSDVIDTDNSYIGGMIGRVRKNSTNERSITLNTVTMTGARVDTKAKYPGGLLGAMWERTNLTVNSLTITGSYVNHNYSGTGSKQSGLVFMGSGKWDIKSLSIDTSEFSSTDTAPASFGLIVNEAYSGDDGLYINLLNRGYTLSNVVVPTSSSDTNYYVDEIAADTKNNSKNDGNILIGGNGTGIININMNAANGALTKIVDSVTPANGTGTYQNRLYSLLNATNNNLIGNQNSRYYYNLDVMMDAEHTKTDGEKFLLWSVSQYAATNISSNFSGAITGITNINLSGLSYYPIPGGSVTIPAYSTVTFGFNAIKNYEGQASTPDSWSRYPDNIGTPKSNTARNQHYLMQTGLFTTVTSLTANSLTLTGDFGYVSGAASGALINSSTSGSVTLNGITLNKLTPSDAASYLLINSIDGTGTATPTLTVSNLSATNYNATGVTLPVAKSLFGTATGQNMTMTFSDIKLDARDSNLITDSNWTPAAATAMTTAYGTSRSIFSTAIFFETLLAAKSSTMEYYYTVDDDWGTGTPRNVTYGKEVSDSREYNSGDGEKKYNIVGSGTRHYTNPISDSDREFNFSAGFLPYVGNYTEKGNNITYPVTEIKVNYKVAGLVEGCGTYNDPYIISTASQFNLIADVVNNGSAPDPIRLPNTMSFASSLPFVATWHTDSNTDSIYSLNQSTSKYIKEGSTTDSDWTTAYVRNYLASAYYVINADLTGTNSLPSDFEGIGKPGTSVNGNIVFHGVIVGKKSNGSAPTITNPSGNPLIYISNGSVIKNVTINITGNLTKTQDKVTISGSQQNAVGDYALYGYGRTLTTSPARYENAVYYGGVIGEIMGGDNIIDDVTVTYSRNTTLSGNYKHLIAEGGMVGCVVNGALIFRGSNTVSGRTVTGGGIYSNQYVGRVINGYAIYESISGRSGSAPDNYNTYTVVEDESEEENGSESETESEEETETEDETENVIKTYTYPIDTIVRNNTKLDVNWSASTITVPDAQSLYIMSLITQSIASTANTSGNNEYGAYSPSYGYNSYITGVARLGDYTDVGCGSSESASSHGDYNNYAKLDSVNNYTNSSSKDGLMKAPVPYIIYRYTKRYGSTTNNPAADFPARKMTADNTKFWDITLSSSNTFASMDSFQAFRGIGNIGINPYSLYGTVNASKTAFKVATFDGGNNTINLNISLPRYGRNQENYFHAQNKSLTQSYLGDELSSPYGHDENMVKLLGLGLFDCVIVNNDESHEYQFQNFTLQGTIEDKVYDSSGIDITGKKTLDSNNKETTGQSQLFCVGGVVGKRVNGNNSDLNFLNITFGGLTITGAYNCGGLIGIDAIGKNGRTGDSNAKKTMKIDGCNSTANGISVTGGYYGCDSGIRHGVGSFVGMTFWCRPYIDGKTDEDDASDITVSNVNTFYDGDYGCSVGGLIGYTGSGAEIKNINLVAANSNAVIGGEKALNAAGFIGFTQAMTSSSDNRTTPNNNDLKDCVYIENCTIQELPIKAKNGAGGFVAKTGNSDSWHTKYIYISDCAVIGNADSKPEIKAYGTGTVPKTNCVGGFVGDLRSSVVTCLIQNSYIENYTIEGWHVGGIIGETTYRSANLRNLYVKDCDIIRNNASSGAIGGIVGYSDQNINGYNLKIDGVVFKKKSGTNSYTESPSDAGFILGANDNNNRVDKFVAIGAYHTTASKVPTLVVKTNGTNTGNFFVFADYNNTSAADITSKTGYASTFGATAANSAGQPSAPYVNVAPHMSVGTNEYLTGDGASDGKAGTIYRDAVATTNQSNRRYTVGSTNDPSSSTTDAATLEKYINNNGSYKDGVFKISTAAAEFGDDFPTGIDNFAMLVINDDSAKANDITPFIKSYIRLVTNAAGSANGLVYNQYAYSCGSTADGTNIDALYKVVIRPCYYNANSSKFVLGTSGNQGLQLFPTSDTTNAGKYKIDSTKADSASDNTCQFSLIDVQYIDPTDSSKIAYHLHVPVYTKKMLTAEFSVVSMSETKYSRSPYAGKITSELAAGRTVGNPTQLVESTNEWTTTFIRYTYPKNQVPHDANWNYDKSIEITLDNNFQTLPNGTELILVDPNANADKYYTMTLDGTWSTGAPITLNLSSFRDERGNVFTPQSLSSIYADSGATGTKDGKAVLYEDYYISMYVPKADDGYTHSVLFSSGNEMTHRIGNDVYKANIDAKLSSLVVLGDLFEHEIVDNSFSVTSSDGSTDDDAEAMTDTHNILKTDVTATVKIKNQSAGAYLANSNVYHSFFITLTSHDADHKVSDIIYGITGGYISNITTYSYENSSGNHGGIITDNSSLGANFIKLDTGDIISAIYDPTTRPVLTIRSETSMIFNDVTAFPYNVNAAEGIGTQVSIKSSIAYRPEDLRFSALNVFDDDPDGKFYYSTTKNSAELSFNAVPTDDTTDEIGYKTNNRSLLGVNGKYGTSHPIIGRSMYNVDDIVDYESAEYVQYTIELYKKVTDQNGTRYVQVNDISDYLTEVNMTDTKVTLEADRTVPSKYLYTGEIDHDDPLDNERMFEATFSCNVLTGDSTHNEYANYKIQLTAQLMGASNSWKDAYLIYTNAKIDPSVIDEDS